MKIDTNNFSENVEYCRYVYNYLSKKSLDGLDTEDIENIASLYISALDEKGFDIEGPVIKNDHLLYNEVKFYLSYLKTKQYDSYDEEIERMKQKMEREFFANNGHGYSDEYDDQSMEDLQEEFHSKFRR